MQRQGKCVSVLHYYHRYPLSRLHLQKVTARQMRLVASLPLPIPPVSSSSSKGNGKANASRCFTTITDTPCLVFIFKRSRQGKCVSLLHYHHRYPLSRLHLQKVTARQMRLVASLPSPIPPVSSSSSKGNGKANASHSFTTMTDTPCLVFIFKR